MYYQKNSENLQRKIWHLLIFLAKNRLSVNKKQIREKYKMHIYSIDRHLKPFFDKKKMSLNQNQIDYILQFATFLKRIKEKNIKEVQNIKEINNFVFTFINNKKC